jgi:hypothetical protein
MTDALQKRLTYLEDMFALQNLKARYAACCDDNYDPERIAELFIPDGTWEASAFGVHRGHAAIKAFMSSVSTSITWALHCVSNPAIQIAPDGQSGTGSWYLYAPCTMVERSGAPEDAVLMTGRYRDDFVKTASGWMFSHLRCDILQISNLDQGWVKQRFR